MGETAKLGDIPPIESKVLYMNEAMKGLMQSASRFNFNEEVGKFYPITAAGDHN